jgi:hypothetical protein
MPRQQTILLLRTWVGRRRLLLYGAIIPVGCGLFVNAGRSGGRLALHRSAVAPSRGFLLLHRGLIRSRRSRGLA